MSTTQPILPLRILHLEDTHPDQELLQAMLESDGIPCEISVADSQDSFRNALKGQQFDLIISDFTLPSFDGLSALTIANEMGSLVPFIFFSGTIGEEVAVESLRNGATDYVLKQRPERLSAAVRRAVAEAKERRQRKDAEERLRRSEARFRAFMTNSPFAAYIKDEECRFVYANPCMEKFFGMRASDMFGKTDFDLLSPEDARRVRSHDLHVLTTGKILETVESAHTADGVYRHWLVSKFLLPDPSGRQLLGGVAIDITERVQAEKRIREQAAMLDKARDAICVLTLDQKILYWNRSAERLYGWTADEALGKDAAELFLQQDPATSLKALETLIVKGEWLGELEEVTKSGKKIIVESRWTLLRSEDLSVNSVLVINTDITEKKQMEQQFLRTQRLESIGTLAGGIAHDLNNVLSPILIAADLLCDEPLRPGSRKILETVKASAERGADMVKQILSFARGLGGEYAVFQIKHLVNDMANLARDTFPRSIEIQTDVAKNLGSIHGDATQFHQVLMNLCVNARDAMPDGGRLLIQADNVWIDAAEKERLGAPTEGPFIRVSVSDTGTGIPPEVLSRIFEPFFTTKEHGKGTGLGLSTVVGIVRAHEGFLKVETKVGKGTTFNVFLPALASPETERNSSKAPVLPGGQGETILLVDDEIAILEINKTTLENFDYRVITARQGAEALAVYQQRREEIDAVVTDMMMPVMDGPALVRALKEINPDVKIICLSGLATGGRLDEVERLDVKAFLMKPYSTEQLLRTVRETLAAQEAQE